MVYPELQRATGSVVSVCRRRRISSVVTLLIAALTIAMWGGAAAAKENLDEQLSNAVQSGNLAMISILLRKGANVNASVLGDTPLVEAIRRRQPALVKFLLENGADAKIRTETGRSPLQCALRSVDVPSVVYLLSAPEAACNIPRFRLTQREEGVDDRDMAIVRLLLDHGADPNSKVMYATILAWAALVGQIDLVRSLLDKGADVNAKFDNGSTAILWAAVGGHTSIVKLLKQRGAIPTLHDAAIIGGKEEFQRFLKTNEDVNKMTECGRTPLMEAAWGGNRDAIEMLLKEGAKINLRGIHGITALMTAALRGNLAAAKLLMRRGADVNVCDDFGRTPLMEAASAGGPDMARLLLDRGAAPNAMDSLGKTALTKAVQFGTVATVRVLLEKGANANAAAEDGWTAFQIAASKEDLNMMKLLVDFGVKVTLHRAAMIGDSAKVLKLLNDGANINETDEFGRTAIVWASVMRHPEIVRILSDNGADVNLRDSNACTPLIWAARKGDIESLKILLERDADVNAAARNGRNALMWAVYDKKAGAVKMLLNKGADVNHRDWTGVSALDLVQHDRQLLTMLKSHGASEHAVQWDQLPADECYFSPRDIMTGAPALQSSHQTISMHSEDVTLRLREHSFVVDAVFEFVNTGGTVTASVGFPKRGNVCGNGSKLNPDFISFDTWINGWKEEFPQRNTGVQRAEDSFRESESRHRNSEHVPAWSYNEWLVKQITFPGHTHTIIRLTYENSYMYVRNRPIRWDGPPPLDSRVATYIVGSGSGCKGSVSKFVFTIDASAIGGVRKVSFIAPKAQGAVQITEDTLRYSTEDFQSPPGSMVGGSIP